MTERRAGGVEVGWRILSRVLVLAPFVAASVLACTARTPPAAPPTPQPTASAAQPVAADAEPTYALVPGSVRLLTTLKTPLEIDAYVPKGLPQVAPFVDDLAELLAAYQRASKGKVKVRLIEANTHALREQAKQDGLIEQPFADDGANDRAAIAQGFLGLVFKYGDEKAVIPALPYQQSDGLEFWVTSKIREIRDKADGITHRIGVVTGKGELKLSDTNLVPNPKEGEGKRPSLQGILTQAFPFYQLEEVGLGTGSSPIDPALVGLIITQPQKDYTTAELRRIDEFLMRGNKALVVYASAVNLKAGSPSLLGTLSTHGLETLLDGYGIHMNKDAVFDSGDQFRVQILTPTGRAVWLRHCGIARVMGVMGVVGAAGPDPTLDNAFAPFFRLDELLFPFASSLELVRDKQPADVKLEVVARSTPDAWVERTDVVDMKVREQWTPKSATQQRNLAAYAQGKLQSAFAGQPGALPDTPERALRSSRVLVLSSSLFLTNPFAYAGNTPSAPNGGDAELLSLAQPYTKYLTSMILSIKNTLDWMSNEEDLIPISAKLTGGSRRSRQRDWTPR